MAGPGRRFRDTYTGNVYSVPWDQNREPDDDEIEQLINQQKRKQIPESAPEEGLFQRINKPLTTWASRTARKGSDYITRHALAQEAQPNYFTNPVMRGLEDFGRRSNTYMAGATGGALEGIGNLIDEQTNPIDIAANISGLKGVRSAGRAGSRLFRAGSALTGIRGAMNMKEGLQEGGFGEDFDLSDVNYAKMATGALETVLSTHGFSSGTKAASRIGQAEDPKIYYGPDPKSVEYTVPRPTLRDRVLARQSAAEQASFNPQKRLGQGTAYAGLGGQVADIRNDPSASRRLIDEASRRGILDPSMPSRGPVYSGRGSVLPDIDVKPLKSEVVTGPARPEAITNRPIQPKKTDTEIEFAQDQASYKAEEAENAAGKGPLANTPEAVLKILAKSGDSRAIRELGRRRGETGSLNFSGFVEGAKDLGRKLFGEETGAVGKIGKKFNLTDIPGNKEIPIYSSDIVDMTEVGGRSEKDVVEIANSHGLEVKEIKKNPHGNYDVTIRGDSVDMERFYEKTEPSSYSPHPLDPRGEKGSVVIRPGPKRREKVPHYTVPEATQAPNQPRTGFLAGARDIVNLNMINSQNPAVQKMKPAYQKWVNSRAAGKGYSYNIKRDFADLDELGMEGIHAYNAGERGGKMADVQTWFDDMHKKVSDSGIKFGTKENYLPQIWDNTKEEVVQALGNKRLTLKPGFTFKSVIDSYQEGMAKGLTPKYKSIPDLMGFYAETANKAIADREFFKHLRDNRLITTKNSPRATNWKPLTQDIFPLAVNKQGNKMEWHAPPEVHAIIENYLSDKHPAVKAVLRGIQLTKDVAMASGIPGTAFNAHGANMLRRSSTVNGIEGFTRALGYMSNPGVSKGNAPLTIGSKIAKGIEDIVPWKSAAKTIEANRQMIPEIMEHGGRLGVEGHDFDDKLSDSVLGKWGSKTANKATELHKDLFETHLFDKMIPALKIDYYKSTVADLIKTGMDSTAARKEAAKAMNLAFAGVNYDELATNKSLLDVSRAFFLAPDWYASNIGLAKNVGQSFINSNHPGAKLYRDIGKGIIGAYALANVANAVTTGMSDDDGPKLMFQNESGRSLDIDTGAYTMNEKGEKKKVYISPFGTAFDAFKIPIGILSEVMKEFQPGAEASPVAAAIRPFRNRQALPAHAITSLLANTDDYGRRIYGRDTYGRDMSPGTELGNFASEVAKPFTPSYVKGGIGYATGSMSLLEAISQSTEAPLAFTRQSMPSKGRKAKKQRKRK